VKKLIVFFVVLVGVGSAGLTLRHTLNITPNYEQSQIVKNANDFFWQNFHAGNYDSISVVIAKLNQALEEQPNDLITTAHLGFTHIWALSERLD
jgi:hypothetical protein